MSQPATFASTCRVSAHLSEGYARDEESMGQMLQGQELVSSRRERKRLQAAGNINNRCFIVQVRWR